MKIPKTILAAALITIAVLLSYSPVFKSGFVSSDDGVLVTDNGLIRDLSSKNLKSIFFSPYCGLYHPAVLLSYAAEYRFFGYNPKAFHLTNLLLHISNTLLVFVIILLLGGGMPAAFAGALLFGVHPAHVESVAWIAERKDVLYSVFYLSSLAAYICYLDQNKRRLLTLSLAMFLLSLLSKPMAVTLPAVLFLIDYFRSRKIGWKEVLEKTPFLILSGIFVYIALNSHYASSDSPAQPALSLTGSLTQAANGPAFYLAKIFWPVKLSYYYPYWQETWKDFFANQPALFAAEALLLAAVFYSVKYGKTVLFGAAFFLITLLPALQILPFGLKIPADRHLYIPSLGIIYIAATALAGLYNRTGRPAKLIYSAIVALTAATLCFATYSRCEIWRNSYTLYTDAIEKYPKLANPYKDRGDVYKDEDKLDYALADYAKALELKPDFAQVFNNRANLYMGQKKAAQAIDDYTAAIKINTGYIAAIYNCAIAYGEIQAYDKALADYTAAIEKRPGYYEAFNNRGILNAKMGLKTQALNDFTKAISINPDFSEAYHNRAFAYCLSGDNVRCAGDVRVLLERKYPVNPLLLKMLRDKKLIQ